MFCFSLLFAHHLSAFERTNLHEQSWLARILNHTPPPMTHTQDFSEFRNSFLCLSRFCLLQVSWFDHANQFSCVRTCLLAPDASHMLKMLKSIHKTCAQHRCRNWSCDHEQSDVGCMLCMFALAPVYVFACLSMVWACLACMCACAWLLAPVCACVLAWPLCVRLLAPCMCMFLWSESFVVLQSEAVKIVFNCWLYCLSVTQSRSCAVCLFTFLLLAGRTLSCFSFFCRCLLS